MADSGAPDEQKIRDIINNEKKFTWNENQYELIFCGKPVTESGEPKTDTFVRAKNLTSNKIEDIKISTKKENFGYVQNHPMKEKLFEFYGPQCKEIMVGMNQNLAVNLSNTPIIFFRDKKNKLSIIEKGAITLGWRNEYLEESAKKENKKTRSLGITLSQNVANKVWFGEGSPEEYLNATICEEQIENSGMPDWVLIKNSIDIHTCDDIFSNLKDIRDYAKDHSNIDYTLQAQNYKTHRKMTCECGTKYRLDTTTKQKLKDPCPNCKKSRKWKFTTCTNCKKSFEMKKTRCPSCKEKFSKYESWNPHEGDGRELAVWIKWEVENGKLKGTIVLDQPFKKAGEVRKNLQDCLTQIGIPDDQNFQIGLLNGKTINITTYP